MRGLVYVLNRSSKVSPGRGSMPNVGACLDRSFVVPVVVVVQFSRLFKTKKKAHLFNEEATSVCPFERCVRRWRDLSAPSGQLASCGYTDSHTRESGSPHQALQWRFCGDAVREKITELEREEEDRDDSSSGSLSVRPCTCVSMC